MKSRTVEDDENLARILARLFSEARVMSRGRAPFRRESRLAELRCGDVEIDCVAWQAKLPGGALPLTHREYELRLHMLDRLDRFAERSDCLTYETVRAIRYVMRRRRAA